MFLFSQGSILAVYEKTRDKIVSKPGFQFEKKKSDKGRQLKMCIVTDCR